MRLAVLFPGAGSFREGMGRELYEQNAVVREVVREHDLRTGTSLADAIWYRTPDSPDLDPAGQAGAVLAVSVGAYEVYRNAYRVPGHVFVGQGVGYLAALVVAGGLELENALRIVRGDRIRRSWFRRVARDVHAIGGGLLATREAKAMAETARAVTDLGRAVEKEESEVDPDEFARVLGGARADAVLEIGPGDLLTAAISPALPDHIPTGALDVHGNAQVVLDNLNIGKYFDLSHLAERVLGQVAGTRDRVGTPESRAGVAELVRRLKPLIKAAATASSPLLTPSGEDIGVIRALTRCWVENGLLKGYTPEEIDASMRRLEGECLLPVRRLGGVNEHTYAAHAIGDLRRAA